LLHEDLTLSRSGEPINVDLAVLATLDILCSLFP
jgi:hypothetical protein